MTSAEGTRRVRRNGSTAAGCDRVNGIHSIIGVNGVEAKAGEVVCARAFAALDKGDDGCAGVSMA